MGRPKLLHEEELARWQELAKEHRNPTTRLAEELGIPYDTVNRWVREGRQRGVLPSTGGRTPVQIQCAERKRLALQARQNSRVTLTDMTKYFGEEVTCEDCGHIYVCTGDEDYYERRSDRKKVCFKCLVKGTNVENAPVHTISWEEAQVEGPDVSEVRTTDSDTGQSRATRPDL